MSYYVKFILNFRICAAAFDACPGICYIRGEIAFTRALHELYACGCTHILPHMNISSLYGFEISDFVKPCLISYRFYQAA